MKKHLLAFTFLLLTLTTRAASILLPMDEAQKEHLKAYGIAFWILKADREVQWLLNYRAGSFLIEYSKGLEDECKI